MRGQVLPNAEVNGLHSLQTENCFVAWSSPAMRAIESMLADIGNRDVPVLLTGEPGVGKKAIARRIHQLSPYCNRPLLNVRCSSLSAEEMSGFLSGYADAGGRPGDSATLVLDEVSELPPPCQIWLADNAWPGNGSADGPQPQVRLISTTCRNLDEEKRAGRFEDELYYRLSGVCLHLPPLRHRREDIPLLAAFFVAKYADLFARPIPSLSPDVMRLVNEHDWPGNISELEAMIRRVVAAGDEKVVLGALGRAAQTDSGRGNGGARPLKQVAKEASRQAERELILKMLTQTRWNRKRAAQKLQISYKALLYKMKQIGLDDSAS
jgi:two-component system, NtrC family, response regulator AtoC